MAPRACSASVRLGGPFVHTERVSTGLCVNRRAGPAGNAGQEVALGCLGPRQWPAKPVSPSAARDSHPTVAGEGSGGLEAGF